MGTPRGLTNSGKEYGSLGNLEGLEKNMEEVEIGDRKSYTTILLLYILYGMSFSLLIPALPALSLQLVNDNPVNSTMIFGTATSVRYFLEFFSAPVLGNLADSKGRKYIFALGFFVSSIEFFLLCFYPSIMMIFITRAMSGLLDAGVATAYAMVTDIAIYNNDIVSQQFGLLAAMFGLSHILGPILGGYLIEIDIKYCFFISACLALLGSILCIIFLEETKPYRSRSRTHSQCDEAESQVLLKEEPHPLNPITGLRIHFSNPKLKRLSVPLALCSVNHGLTFIWYLYMKYRFQSSPPNVGFYISWHGLMNALAQGVMIKFLIPKYLSEKNALLYGLILSGFHTLLNGFCNEEWELYLLTMLFFLGVIHFPALKALIVNESIKSKHGASYQANLQGAISSIRTVSMSVGSLLFSSLFTLGISLKPVAFPALPFLVGSLICLIAYIYVRLDYISEPEEAEENVEFSMNIGEGMGLLNDENDMLKD
jgi:DHA1 family tetracycline resistance protein-like MFS transporter